MKKEFDFSWIFQDPLRRVLDEGIVWEARPLLKLSCFQVLNVNRWMPGTVDFSAGCAIFTREDPSLLPRTRTNLWGLEEWWTDDFKMKQMLKMSKDLYITLLSHLLFITFTSKFLGQNMSVINFETWTYQNYHCFAWKVMSQMKLKEDGRMRSRDSDPWWNVAAWHPWHRQAYRSTFSAHSATTLERAGTVFVNDFGWVMLGLWIA